MCRKPPFFLGRKTGVGKCPNWTSPNYWGYNLQQIFEGDVQNPQRGTFTNLWKMSKTMKKRFCHHFWPHLCSPKELFVSELQAMDLRMETPGCHKFWLSWGYNGIFIFQFKYIYIYVSYLHLIYLYLYWYLHLYLYINKNYIYIHIYSAIVRAYGWFSHTGNFTVYLLQVKDV